MNEYNITNLTTEYHAENMQYTADNNQFMTNKETITISFHNSTICSHVATDLYITVQKNTINGIGIQF